MTFEYIVQGLLLRQRAKAGESFELGWVDEPVQTQSAESARRAAAAIMSEQGCDAVAIMYTGKACVANPICILAPFDPLATRGLDDLKHVCVLAGIHLSAAFVTLETSYTTLSED
jgi:hypothetical protein